MLARKIEQSSLQGKPPIYFVLWIRMLLRANHTSVQKGGFVFNRGELRATYDDLIEWVSYFVGFRKEKTSKTVIRNCLAWFRKENMITTRKTTRGLVIKIANYDFYQCADNYEDHNDDHTKNISEPRIYPTINKKEKKEKEINTARFSESVKNSQGYIAAKKMAESLKRKEDDKYKLP